MFFPVCTTLYTTQSLNQFDINQNQKKITDEPQGNHKFSYVC